TKEEENVKEETIIELKGIRKEFPGVVALDNVNMMIKESKVHALVGENGAGKSTLMKILSGTYTNYEGSVVCEGKEIHIRNEKEAFDYGLSIVAQELNYVAELSIAENLFLGREQKKGKLFLDKQKRLEETKRLLTDMGLDYDPAEKMGNLNVAQRQMIEILKAISRNSKVIIMDEPTSALTSKESELLFSKVNELKQKGIGFVFISHRLDEVFELCDEYTVLRDGKWIASGNLTAITMDELIAMMVGRDIKDIYPKIPAPQSKLVLDVKHLSQKETFQDISFQVNQGEIFGLAGMVGAGRSEIVQTIFGLTRSDQGEVVLDGKSLKIHSVHDAIKNGIAMVTEDRRTYGFVGVRSVSDNVILPNGDIYAEKGIWNKKKINSGVDDICKKLSIKAPNTKTLVENLSGGNQQKVVLAKWLVRNIKLLILDEPTRGIDVGAKQEIYSLITEFAKQGMAIILISSDMPEVLSMSHRVGVIGEGKLLGILDRNQMSQNKIMKMIVEAKNNE
ncbi:sugar ABC transporter ATP-binding protein, partial [Muricomes intestini]|uniref:sugar ABC transporter ATP-binding protein n=1 Tax=Muricomes intestini TaxID=1796634 RepID=UPI002FE0D11F